FLPIVSPSLPMYQLHCSTYVVSLLAFEPNIRPIQQMLQLQLLLQSIMRRPSAFNSSFLFFLHFMYVFSLFFMNTHIHTIQNMTTFSTSILAHFAGLFQLIEFLLCHFL